MKVRATKSGVKNIIKEIIAAAQTKVIDVAMENGYKIALSRLWNKLDEYDLTHYDSADEYLAEERPFADKSDNYESIISIAEDLEQGRLVLVSDNEIKAFSKKFLNEKDTYEKTKKCKNAEKIEKLQKQIAKAQRELDRLLDE